ncbi:uncharacterized protein PD653B2_4955, partial [Nocardioides sp. PD653-B2]
NQTFSSPGSIYLGLDADQVRPLLADDPADYVVNCGLGVRRDLDLTVPDEFVPSYGRSRVSADG